MLSLRSLLVAAAFLPLILPAADWPQWRGPDRTGHVPAGERVPETLPAEPKILWRLKIGEGFSSPVVAGGRVIYMDNVGGMETVHALDQKTARELWKEPVADVFKDTQGPPGPRCTPMIDGDRVYAQSSRGEFNCRALADGKLLWRTSFTNDFGSVFIGEKGTAPGATRHGYNASPLVDGARLYLTVGSTNGASMVCFDKMTGKVIWKSQDDLAAYAAPFIATVEGIRQVLYFTSDGLIGLRADTGSLLWRFPIKTAYARHVTTPVVYENLVVVSSHQAGLFGVRITRGGAGQKAEQAWVSKDGAMNFSSPVAVGKHLYGLGPAKNLICVEIPTGKLAWTQDGYFPGSAEKAEAGFLVMGKNILSLTDSGMLVLFEASPAAFKEISRAQVCAATWCNPAYTDGKLYLRDGVKGTGELLCAELLP